MVCLGNICRSPLADGVLRQKVQNENLDVFVDSAGTSNYHIDEAPDERMQKTALSKGYDISQLRGRQFTSKDYDVFEVIYVMDQSNYNNVVALARNESDKAKVKMFLNELHPGLNEAVPDPYFGGEAGFLHVFDLVDKTTDVIINQLKASL